MHGSGKFDRFELTTFQCGLNGFDHKRKAGDEGCQRNGRGRENHIDARVVEPGADPTVASQEHQKKIAQSHRRKHKRQSGEKRDDA